GIGAARYLGRIGAGRAAGLAGPVLARLRPARGFADLLDRVYPLGSGWTGWAGPDTVVCRCEEVPLAAVRRAVVDGARDVRTVRSFSRCGMGYCQGRVCGPVVQGLLADLTGVAVREAGDLHGRPLVVPVPLGELSRTDPAGW
ncbi:MAG TPA: (2Fe-2S)-binding protein, partial [Mycobacteriales bacterium]|nr:(2Fe-2S)-binding protein [Mycobacteriales bacterium]